MFQPVASKPDFPQMEEATLRFWKESRIFEKSVDLRRGGTRFTLFEGPPTTNGSPGIHHVLSRAFKDVITRYKAMRGYYAPRKAGWDTHGLPVELEVEKTLGFKSKSDIERFGVAEFNERCRQNVYRYLKDWQQMTERIAFWLDLEHPYITLDNKYIESCWWAVKQLWDKGLVYQGYRVTPHCPRCGTSLSSHEVALGYRDDASDPSVYIKFEVNRKYIKNFGSDDAFSSGKPIFLLAWTTTPWTLPGNTALAVAPEADYVLLEGDREYLILGAAPTVRLALEGYSKVWTIHGEELVGWRYKPLFNPHSFGVERRKFQGEVGGEHEILALQEAVEELTYPVIGGDFVSLDDGTGIVHIAPAFGEVDFEAGKRAMLDFVQPVNLDGAVTGTYSFAGKFVKDADPLVLNDLRERGLLYRSERITHTYPFCWRCEAPLLYYAKPSWYIRTTALKKELIAGNHDINWYPDHIKYGRFGDWLENNVDWAFSRERYWGTPLNVWRCSKCGGYECVGSLEEMRSRPGLAGLKEPLDMHRPHIDEVTFDCAKCGGQMRRQTEVIDCWFDSGAMPFAQWHFPFENKDEFAQAFPADFISEAVDQTRGWFYSLHVLSVLLFGRSSFRNVICLGHVLDAQGEKMSKAKGNVVDPWRVIKRYGADAVRWYLFTASPPGNARRFSEEMVAETLRNFILTLWNVYSFFVMYANIDGFEPGKATQDTDSDLDRWILSELSNLVKQVTAEMESYEPVAAARKIVDFVDVLSNWYVRRNRRRFWKSGSDADKLAAYSTLYECLTTTAKLLAPFTPFLAEELYRNLVASVPGKPESVHLSDFPVADISRTDETLMAETRVIMNASSIGRAARSKAGIKVRQPVADAIVKVRSRTEAGALGKLAYQLEDELNAKKIRFTEEDLPTGTNYSVVMEASLGVAVNLEITPELAAEGRAREVVRRLQTMRRAAGFEISDHIITYFSGDPRIEDDVEKFADYIRHETLSDKLLKGGPEDGAACIETHNIDGVKLTLAVKKIG